jgi:hypothetical protein
MSLATQSAALAALGVQEDDGACQCCECDKGFCFSFCHVVFHILHGLPSDGEHVAY